MMDLTGKTVALVGRAASIHERGDGARIDSADVVIRVNWLAPWEGDPARIGARTDAVIHAYAYCSIGEAAEAHGMVAWRKCRSTGQRLAEMVGRPSVNPRTGVTALGMVLDAGAERVYLTGYDLYETATATRTGTGDRTAGKSRRGHDNETDRLILRALIAGGRVDVDDTLRAALDRPAQRARGDRSMKRPIQDLDHARHWVRTITDAAHETGVPVHADYGTLLGIVREQDVIAHDYDLDFSLFSPRDGALYSSTEWHTFLGTLRRNGAHIMRHRNRADYVMRLGSDLVADLFVWQLEAGGVWTRRRYRSSDDRRNKGKLTWHDWIASSRQMPFAGGSVWVPEGACAMVRHRYGDGWRTPEVYL
jgi:hypothetical protein